MALLNDDTTEVGRVHLGIVHVFKLAEPKWKNARAMITEFDISWKRRIARTSRNDGDLVADLPRFPRAAVALLVGSLLRRGVLRMSLSATAHSVPSRSTFYRFDDAEA